MPQTPAFARVCLGFSQPAHSVALKEFSRSASLCEPGKTGRSPMERVRERTRTRRKDGEATTQAQRAACVCARTPARPAAARASKRAAVWDGRAGVQAPHATRARLSWPPDTLHARDTTANVRSRSRQPLRGESAALPYVLCAVAARVSRRVCVHTHRTTAAAHSLAIGATFTSATWRDARDEKFHAKAARDDLFSLSRATPSHPSRSHPHKWRLPLCFVPQTCAQPSAPV